MKPSARMTILACIALLLAGCGGGGGSSGNGRSGDGSGASSAVSRSDGATTNAATRPQSAAPTAPASPSPHPDKATAGAAVTLSWVMPVTRENGEPLTAAEITGFEIYYYKDDCNDMAVCGTIDKVPGDVSSTVITLVEPGLWHFAAAVVDSNGVQSDFSNPVTVTVTL